MTTLAEQFIKDFPTMTDDELTEFDKEFKEET